MKKRKYVYNYVTNEYAHDESDNEGGNYVYEENIFPVEEEDPYYEEDPFLNPAIRDQIYENECGYQDEIFNQGLTPEEEISILDSFDDFS